MLRYSRSIWFILLLAIPAINAQGQWKIVAQNLAKVSTYYGGSCFKNGIIWFADGALFRSTDSGNTWNQNPIPEQPFDMEFYDSLNGILCGTNNTWITQDGGVSWQVLLSRGSATACFLNTPSGIAVAQRSGGFVMVTIDRGITWNKNLASQPSTFCIRYSKGTIIETGGSPAGGSFINSSTDDGRTWQKCKSSYDFDSYCFAVDSCDANRIYIAHEDALVQTDQFSKIILTTDNGTTWQARISNQEPFFSGSIAEGRSVVYCQSMSNGIFRSTDRGQTWTSIGGPSVAYDTRLITAIDDNIVLALDNAGNIWRTENSGGSLVTGNVSLALPSQSMQLERRSCTLPADSAVPIKLFAICGYPTGLLDTAWISGSTAFSVSPNQRHRSLAAIDSISVSYNGTKGPDTSQLHLRYDLGFGTLDTTVLLIGTVQFVDSKTSIILPSEPLSLQRTNCTSSLDTSIPIHLVAACGTPRGLLDSLWISGSSAFTVSSSQLEPRPLTAIDSILVSYLGTKGRDTSQLHLRYDIGSGTVDTTIILIGGAQLSTAQVHRESASSYYGQLDTLSLAVDLSSQINIDSLWPYITGIEASFSWDSSIVSEDNYIPPTGWSLKSLSNNGNWESITIRKNSGNATAPLNIGTALFLPASTQLAGSWVQLSHLALDLGSQTLELCVTDNEDNHWAVKTLGVPSSVVSESVEAALFSIYPNPATGTLYLTSSEDVGPTTIEIFDMLGTKQSERVALVMKENPVELLLPAVSGVYSIVVRSEAGMEMLRAVEAK